MAAPSSRGLGRLLAALVSRRASSGDPGAAIARHVSGALPAAAAGSAGQCAAFSASAWRPGTGAGPTIRAVHALALPDEPEKRDKPRERGGGGGGAGEEDCRDGRTSAPARRTRAAAAAGPDDQGAPPRAGRASHQAGPDPEDRRQPAKAQDRGWVNRGGHASGSASTDGGGAPRQHHQHQHRHQHRRGGGGGGGGWTDWSPAPLVVPPLDWDGDGSVRTAATPTTPATTQSSAQRARSAAWAAKRADWEAGGGDAATTTNRTWTPRPYNNNNYNNNRGRDGNGGASGGWINRGTNNRTWSPARGGGNAAAAAAASPSSSSTGWVDRRGQGQGHNHQHRHQGQAQAQPHQHNRRGGWVPHMDDRPAAAGRRDGRRWNARDGSGGEGVGNQPGMYGGTAANNNNGDAWRRHSHDRQDTASAETAERRRKATAAAAAAAASASRVDPADIPIPAGVTVRELARLLDTGVEALEDALADLGARPGSEEEAVDADAAELLALELGKAVVVERPPSPDGAAALPRPPVVAVLGHVDHGKTTLLDALRDTAVAAGEAGGITQHIGAFEVAMPASASTITFLDTPGHAAFSAMRSRGAHLTDIAVLVVDARDGVKPQTKEAIAHIRAAGCPLVVALTKCDLPDADPARVRRQLQSEEGLELEEAGGAVQAVEVAAKAGIGLRELEEALLLQAELMELRASPAGRPAEATVVEARMDKGQGPVATIIVTAGTLEPGQAVVVGCEWGKVRSLAGPDGRPVDRVLPGHPAEVTGLRGVPQAGDTLAVLPSEDRARRLSTARAQRAEEKRQASTALGAAEAVAADAAAAAVAAATKKASRRGAAPGAAAKAAAAAADLAAVAAAAAAAAPARVLLVVKADTQGSCEAMSDALEALALDGVRVEVASAAVGPVTLSDIQHAAAIGARVLAFGVRTGGPPVEREAKRLSVPVAGERVIYRLLDSVAGWVAGAAPRVGKEVVAGRADVLQVFGGGAGASSTAVAGVRVGEGALAKGETLRVVRGGATIHEGACTSLRRHKLDVARVGRGTECGVVLEGFSDFQPGDVLQCVVMEYVTPSAEDVLGFKGGA